MVFYRFENLLVWFDKKIKPNQTKPEKPNQTDYADPLPGIHPIGTSLELSMSRQYLSLLSPQTVMKESQLGSWAHSVQQSSTDMNLSVNCLIRREFPLEQLPLWLK